MEENKENTKEDNKDFETKITGEKTEEKRPNLVSQKLLEDSLDLETTLEKLPL